MRTNQILCFKCSSVEPFTHTIDSLSIIKHNMLQCLISLSHVLLLDKIRFTVYKGYSFVSKSDCMALTGYASQNTVPLKLLNTVPSNQFSVEYAQPVGVTIIT